MSKKTSSAGKRRLGRGLSSLISRSAPEPVPEPADETPLRETAVEESRTPSVQQTLQLPPDEPAELDPGPQEIPVEQISPNPYQPRREFDNDELAELTASVRQHGILQPLLVTPRGDNDVDSPYILVAGERRLRAAKLAALKTVPCVMREADARQLLEWAIIENVQRADLNPIDRAKAYRDYIDRFSLTQAQAAVKLGQPRGTIANYLRLLDLSDDVQQLLLTGGLSFGHAKALAGIAGRPDMQLALAGKAAARNLSVRQLEALIEAENSRGPLQTLQSRRSTRQPYIVDLEQQLTQAVGTKVTIRTGRAKNTGGITIDFYSLDDFDRIIRALGVKVES